MLRRLQPDLRLTHDYIHKYCVVRTMTILVAKDKTLTCKQLNNLHIHLWFPKNSQPG